MSGAAASRFGLSARLACFYGAFFMGVGVMMPYFPLWLADRGLGPGEIGVLLAVGPWARLVANPVAARIADRRRERKRPLVVLSIGATGAFALYQFGHDFPVLLGVAVAFGLLVSPITSLGDNLTMLTAYAAKLDYGRIRLWGSITFIAAATGTGLWLERGGVDLVWWLALACLGLTALAAFALPDTRPPPGEAVRAPIWRLLRNRLYLLFLATAGLNMAAHSVLYGFGSLHWRAAGLTGAEIGWLWAEGVIAEIALFAMSNAIIRRIGPARLLVVAAIGGIVRWLATGLFTSFEALVAIQLLHGLTFGAAHLAAMHFLIRAAPPALSATAQSLFSAIASGAVMGLAMFAAGYLYGALGAWAFVVMAGVSAVGLVPAVLLARHWDGATIRL